MFPLRHLPSYKNKASRQWRCIRLETPQLAKREHERMIMLFNCIFMAAGRPRDVSLWMTAMDDNGGIDVYLSPRATPLVEELIRRYHASVCEHPSASMELIAGHDSQAQDHQPPTVGLRTIASSRRYLPAPYTYRSVRAVQQPMANKTWLADSQMTPFVRRFIHAWAHPPITTVSPARRGASARQSCRKQPVAQPVTRPEARSTHRPPIARKSG